MVLVTACFVSLFVLIVKVLCVSLASLKISLIFDIMLPLVFGLGFHFLMITLSLNWQFLVRLVIILTFFTVFDEHGRSVHSVGSAYTKGSECAAVIDLL